MSFRRLRGPSLTLLALAFAACEPDAPQSFAKVDPVYDRYADSLHVDAARMRHTALGVLVSDLRDGHGAQAGPGSRVLVHYTGWLPNGTRFDSSRDRGQPLTVQLGAHQVIPGWEDGIYGMREGGRRLIVIPADAGYGPVGVPGLIPPNSNLVFDVELVGVR